MLNKSLKNIKLVGCPCRLLNVPEPWSELIKHIPIFSLVRHLLYFTVPNPLLTWISIYSWLIHTHCALCCLISASYQPQPYFGFQTRRAEVHIKALRGHLCLNEFTFLSHYLLPFLTKPMKDLNYPLPLTHTSPTSPLINKKKEITLRWGFWAGQKGTLL